MICSDVTIRVLIRKLPLFEIYQGKRVVVSSERTLLILVARVIYMMEVIEMHPHRNNSRDVDIS